MVTTTTELTHLAATLGRQRQARGSGPARVGTEHPHSRQGARQSQSRRARRSLRASTRTRTNNRTCCCRTRGPGGRKARSAGRRRAPRGLEDRRVARAGEGTTCRAEIAMTSARGESSRRGCCWMCASVRPAGAGVESGATTACATSRASWKWSASASWSRTQAWLATIPRLARDAKLFQIRNRTEEHAARRGEPARGTAFLKLLKASRRQRRVEARQLKCIRKPGEALGQLRNLCKDGITNQSSSVSDTSYSTEVGPPSSPTRCTAIDTHGSTSACNTR